MGARRRILFIAPYLPREDARHAGGRATAFYLSGLAGRHDVDLVCLGQGDDASVARRLWPELRSIEVEIYRATIARKLAGMLSDLGRGEGIVRGADRRLRRRVEARLAADRYDLVQVEHEETAFWVPPPSAGAWVLDLHDVISAVIGVEPAANPLPRLLPSEEEARRRERELSARYDGLTVRSEHDRNWLAGMGCAAPVCVLRHPVFIPPNRAPLPERIPGRLLLTGSFRRKANVQAARELALEILPLIRAARPDAHLLIAGDGADAALAGLARAGVEVRGFVPDLAPLHAEAALLVLPLHSGGGQITRVPEALAHGLPVVTTPAAAAGLEGLEGVVTAAEPAGLAAAAVGLLGDAGRWEEASRRGRESVARLQSPESIAQELERFHSEVLDAKARAAAGSPARAVARSAAVGPAPSPVVPGGAAPDAPPPQAPSGAPSRAPIRSTLGRRLFRWIGGLLFLGFAGKVLGLLVQVLVARFLGVDASLDAYLVAASLPDLLVQVFMLGALSQMMIPVLAAAGHERGRAAADEFAGRVLGLNLLVGVFVGLVAWVLAPLLVRIMAPGFDEARDRLTVQMVRLLLVNVSLTGFIYHTRAVLQLSRRFLLAAGSAVVASLVQLAAVVLLVPRYGANGLAWSAIALNVATGIFLIGGCLAHRVSIRPRWPALDSRLKHLLGLTWVMGAFALVSVLSLTTDRYFASLLPAGSIAVLGYAWRFEPVFLVLIAGAATAPIYTELSEAAARADGARLAAALTRGIQVLAAMVLPAAALLSGLASPLIGFFFQRGAFSAASTVEVARVLAVLSIAFACWAIGSLLVQTLNAIRRPGLSLVLGILSFVLNLVLDALLYRRFGVFGVALATTMVAVPVTSFFLHAVLRRLGVGWSRPLRAYLGVVLLLALLGGVIAHLAARLLSGQPPLLRLAAGGIAGLAVQVLGFRLLRPTDFRFLLRAWRR